MILAVAALLLASMAFVSWVPRVNARLALASRSMERVLADNEKANAEVMGKYDIH